MVKKMIFAVGTLAVTTTALLLTPSYVVNDQSDNQQNNQIILYDNHYFSNEDQLFRYYIQKYPEVIGNLNVIGDVSNALIDFDYEMLNRSLLPKFDYDLVTPAYYKSNGQTTSSLDEALRSYANPIFIKERYQGITDLFLTANDAKKDRQKNALDLYQGFLNMPGITIGDSSFRYNPLNTDDYDAFADDFKLGLNDQNLTFNTNDYQKTLITKDVNKMDSFLQNTNLSGLEVDFANGNDSFSWPSALNEPEKINYLGTNNANNVQSIPNEDHHNITGWKGMQVRISLFDLPTSNEVKPWDLNAKSRGSNPIGKGDHGYTNVAFANNTLNNVIKVKDEMLINEILDNNSNLAKVNIASREDSFAWSADDSHFGNNFVSLWNDQNWSNFAKNSNDQISALKDILGSNFTYELNVSLNKDKISDPNNTNFVKHWWTDVNGGILWQDEKHYIEKVDTSYFDYELKFIFTPNPNSILINTNQKFFDYYNYIVNIRGQKWNETLYTIFENWIKNPIIVKNEQDLIRLDLSPNEIKALANLESQVKTVNKDNINSIKELISLKDGSKKELDQEGYPLFNVKRDSDNQVNIELANKINKKEKTEIKHKIIEKLGNKKDDYFPSTNYLYKDIITSILSFLFKDDQLASTISYEIAFDLLGKMAQLKTPITFGLRDLADNQQDKSIVNIIEELLHSLQRYLVQAQEKGQKIDQDFIDNSLQIQNSQLNINKLITFAKEGDGKIYLKVPQNISYGNGKYLMLLPQWFNSSLKTSSSENVGASGVFVNNIKYEANKEIILKTNPPLVRIMYNLDGEIIMGDPHKKVAEEKPDGEDIENKEVTSSKNDYVNNYIYDDEDILLYNAISLADVKWDPFYVYYHDPEKGEELILNQRANIYTLKTDPLGSNGLINLRYFKTFSGLKKYTLDKLMLEAIIIS